MATANELLSEFVIRVAQNEDDSYTLYCYDVTLDENGNEVSRARMDLSTATIVQQVKDDRGVQTGTPTDAFLLDGTTVTLEDGLASFDIADLGKKITVTGQTSPGNNGTFTITGVPSPRTIEYSNPAGVAEAAAAGAAYSISDIVIDKNSSDTDQIEIHPDQVTEATKGTAVIKYVGADTTQRVVGERYWHDVWVHRDSGVVRIVKKSRFYIDDGVYEPSPGVIPDPVGLPAPQTPQHRSFKFTLPSAGDSFTVPIPGTGMIDASYCIEAHLEDRNGGPGCVFETPTAQRQTTQFQLECSGALNAGAVINFILRDSE